MPTSRHGATRRILRESQAAEYLGLSLSTMLRVAKADPSFPAKIAITAFSSGRDIRELDRWIAERPRLAAGERGMRGEATRVARRRAKATEAP